MDIISSTPRSFKLDSKSSEAWKLKQAVVQKHFEFFGNDKGNVLAEYVVELVCNGRNQKQARDDLEAFLGYQSGKFVSWLWDHLLNSDIHSASSNRKDASLNNFYGDRKDKGKRTIRSTSHLNHSPGVSDTDMSKDDKRHNQAVLPTKQISSDTFGLEEEFQRWCPDPCVADTNAKEGRPKHRSLVPQNSTYDVDSGAMAHKSSRLQCSCRSSGSNEQSLPYGDRNKMVISDNCLLSDSLHYSPKRKLVPRNLQPGTEKPLSRVLPVTSGTRPRLSSRAPHDVPDQLVRPRRSVWDRLGKPIEKDAVMTDDKIRLEEHNTVKKKKQHHGGPNNHGFKKIIVPDDCRGHVVDQVRPHKKALLSIPEAPYPSNNSSLAQMEGFRNAAYMRTFLKPVEADMRNVKLRLHEIEIEMKKFRAKQMETKEDVELSVPLYSGIEKRSDEDLESRTVLVTNVHCNATKKALMSHFSECGAVVDATLLSDRGSDLPKGSAYVVFSCKEMADKAVAMSGTSFFSRTLQIVHKATMQKGSLPLLQPAVESPLSGRPPAKRKVIIRKKREPSTKADSSEPANAGSSQPQKPVQNEVGVE